MNRIPPIDAGFYGTHNLEPVYEEYTDRIGSYMGLVIDESVIDEENDWKFYLAHVDRLVGKPVLVNPFGNIVELDIKPEGVSQVFKHNP